MMFFSLISPLKSNNKQCDFITRTYQKPINIMPNSAHPRGMIKGVVFGLLRNYYKQNTYREDYFTMAMLLYKRLKARGWNRETLEPIFITAHERISNSKSNLKPKSKPTASDNKKMQIIIWSITRTTYQDERFMNSTINIAESYLQEKLIMEV